METANNSKLFSGLQRDRAIDTTISNLIKTGVLLPAEVANFMRQLTGYTDIQLGIALIESHLSLEHYEENC